MGCMKFAKNMKKAGRTDPTRNDNSAIETTIHQHVHSFIGGGAVHISTISYLGSTL
jgi:hypothetical protein